MKTNYYVQDNYLRLEVNIPILIINQINLAKIGPVTKLDYIVGEFKKADR